MKRYVYLLLFPALFLISCGGDDPDVKDDSGKTAERDLFREGVDKLKRNGFLKEYSGARLDSLVAVYRVDSSNGMNNLLVASGDMLKIGIALNGRAPHEVYEAAIDTIAMKYPDLKPSAVKHHYLPNFPNGKDTGWVLLEQQFAGKWYSRKLYYFDDWPIDNFMYCAYNTMLADQNKDTRLYLAQFFTSSRDTGMVDDFLGDIDVSRMGIMRLTQAQADSVLSIPGLALEPQPEFEVYNSTKVDEELQKLWSTGIFSNEKWFDTIASDVRHNSIYRQQDIIDFYDDYFATLMHDTLNPFNPYEEMLLSLQMKSQGFFEPSGISDQPVGATNVHAVRFVLNGKAYEKDFQSKNGVESPYLLDFVNEALAEQGAGGAFYTVSLFHRVSMAIFIEDAKLEEVKKSGFFTTVEKGAASELKIMYGDQPAAF
jgi:hypothetical protein